MELTVKPVTRDFSEQEALRALYETAFPENERAPFRILMKRTKRPDVEFLAFYDGEALAGMLYLLHRQELTYIFYFAVAEALRNQGYGSCVLQMLKARYPQQSIFLAMEQLEEDAPNYEQRVRRRRFYEANGFHLLPKKVQEGPVVFDLAGTDNRVTAKGYLGMVRSFVGWMRLWVPIRFFE